MFCGDSRHTVDPKSRVFVPKRFQQDLPLDPEGNRNAILTRGLDGCLFLFPESGLERALSRMDTEAFAKPSQRKLQRLFFSFTARVTLDASGRLLIPEKLRTLAGIEREVVMVGVVDRVEVWEIPDQPTHLRVEIAYRLRRTGSGQTLALNMQLQN